MKSASIDAILISWLILAILMLILVYLAIDGPSVDVHSVTIQSDR